MHPVAAAPEDPRDLSGLQQPDLTAGGSSGSLQQWIATTTIRGASGRTVRNVA